MLSANIKSQEYYGGEYEFAFGNIQIALSESIYFVVAQTSCGDILNKKNYC